MIAFPTMLLSAAEEAGIPVPPDADDFDPEEYVRFQVFCNAQLGRRMPSPTSHWTNAKVIALIPEKDLKTVSFNELVDLGFE